jgi:hypothetical protein
MRSKWVVLLIPFVALAALGFYRPAAPEPRALSLSIVFGSEINGYITPCGCSKPMVGGIPAAQPCSSNSPRNTPCSNSKTAT